MTKIDLEALLSEAQVELEKKETENENLKKLLSEVSIELESADITDEMRNSLLTGLMAEFEKVSEKLEKAQKALVDSLPLIESQIEAEKRELNQWEMMQAKILRQAAIIDRQAAAIKVLTNG